MSSSNAEAAASPLENDAALSASDANELERVHQELKLCQNKFAQWKEKAKAGVDHLRAQIVTLTARLNDAEQLQASITSICSSSLVRGAALSQTQADLTSTHASAVSALYVDAFSSQYRVLHANSESLGKLQRTVQGLSDRLKETQHALQRSNKELQQRNDALRVQDETTAGLKRRLDGLEQANATLEEQLVRAPNVDEWRQTQEEQDHQLERSRLEFEARESQLILHHHNDIQALNTIHEEEVRALHREAEDRIAQAVQNAIAGQMETTTAASDAATSALAVAVREVDDAAYMDLLNDYRTLEDSASVAIRERDEMQRLEKTLLRELQSFFDTVGSGGIADRPPGESRPAELSLPELTISGAVRLVAEQRVRSHSLQEELGQCRREMMTLKRAKAGAPVDGLGAQQTQYLRSVVVQLLCSLSDATVAKRLLPVLSMLLKFTEDDLKAIAKAMPHWAR